MGRTTAVKSLMVKPSVLTEGKTLTDSDAGRTFFLNAAAGFTITLPSPRGGVGFKFIVKTAPSTGNYNIYASSDIIAGQVKTSDIYYGGGSRPSVQLPGVQYARFIAGLSVVGDTIEMISDGTYWYSDAFCSKWDAIRFVEESASSSVSPSVSTSRSPSVSTSRSPSVSVSLSPSRSPSISPSAS